MDLHINVCSLLSSPFVGGDSFCEIKSRIAESSPANMISRIMSIALRRLGYKDRFMALPLYYVEALLDDHAVLR